MVEETDFLVDAKARRVLDAAAAEGAPRKTPPSWIRFARRRAARGGGGAPRVGRFGAPAFDGLMAALVVDGADAAAEAAARRNVVDVMVPPDEIIGRLVRFTESERRAGDKKARALAALKAAAAADAESGRDAPAPRKTKEELESEFWDRMANVVGPRTYRAWGALENGLAEYHALLRRRRDALEDAGSAGGAKRRAPRVARPVPQLQDQRRAAGAPTAII